jgi:NAD-dependent SIR2 family protein deacetylase
MECLERADAVLVVGSSLMVYSGYRFVQAAAQAAKPVGAINLGRTRADGLLALKVSEPCASALASLSASSYDTLAAATIESKAAGLVGERC